MTEKWFKNGGWHQKNVLKARLIELLAEAVEADADGDCADEQ